MKIRKITKLALLGAALLSIDARAFAPSSLFRPYDQALRLSDVEDKKYAITASVEGGDRSTAKSVDRARRNVLAVHDESQSTLAMLKNVPTAVQAEVNTLLAKMGMPVDDGKRGHFKFSGDYEQLDYNLAARYQLPLENVMPGKVHLNLHVPIIYKKISKFNKTDLTLVDNPMPYPTDLTVSAEMSNMLDIAQKLGGLSLEDWSKSGLGDIALTLDWHELYRQEKEYLKGVELYAHLGVSLPTGAKKDEDKVFSMALGNDGAWGLPLGAGLNLHFVKKIRAGLNIDFLGLFDKTKMRRIKTNRAQTEFLLLNKADATKEHGLLWQFYLYAQAFRMIHGFSGKVAYQFLKKDADRLSPVTSDVSADIANTARSLSQATLHNVIFSLDFDPFFKKNNPSFVPQFSIFYKQPVNGKGFIDLATVGGQLHINF